MNASPTPCETLREQLTPYLLGDLEPVEAQAVRDHLDLCEGCRASAREIRLTLDLLRDALAADASQPVQLDPARRRRLKRADWPESVYWVFTHQRMLANAAVVLILCVTAASLFLPSLHQVREDVRRSAPAASALAPSAASRFAGKSLDETIQLDAAPVVFNEEQTVNYSIPVPEEAALRGFRESDLVVDAIQVPATAPVPEESASNQDWGLLSLQEGTRRTRGADLAREMAQAEFEPLAEADFDNRMDGRFSKDHLEDHLGAARPDSGLIVAEPQPQPEVVTALVIPKSRSALATQMELKDGMEGEALVPLQTKLPRPLFVGTP